MSTFKCKMCGGTLEIQSGSTVAECEYCGAKQTLPKLDDEKRANLYDRANHFRRSNEFDKASAIYEQILAEDNTDAEAYWSLVLCRYGIEYVEDPLSHRRVPTVHRAQFTSIFDDDNYKSALKNSDTYQRVIYEEEAKAINEIQKGILAISQKEEPFDVFICYKETDDSGKRTHDSVLAQDLYYQLKQEGFKVFFARITLEDKLGSAYEPYIFAALNSAKVMVVLGTKPEYFNAVWVKNEWSRFLSLIKHGEKKMLIPAYKDMDPYNLPKEFSHLQAQDMSKLGFMQDLIRGIKKILGRDKKPATPTVERVVVQGDGNAQDAAPLLRRAFLFCEDGEFDNADEYAEKVLDINPECAEAYVVKLLIELGLKKPSDLAQYKAPISDSPNYQKAIRFATPEYRETIEGYNDAIIKRIDKARKDEVYARGVELMKLHRYDEAVQYFQKIPTYKDSTQKIDNCKKLKETERRDGIYDRATQLLNLCQFDEAAQLFESISDHKDSKEKIKLCGERKETSRKDAIYSQAMNRVRPQNADDAAMKKSIEELQTISGYRDVDDQIRALNARLEKWYEDKKKAEEAARIKAEEDRRTREREAEIARIAAEKRKKKLIKTAKIGIPSVIALIVVLILLFTWIMPLIRYNQADDLLEKGELEEADKIYRDLDGFSDSEQRIALINGTQKIQKGLFDAGITEILSAGIPVKINYGMNGGDFSGVAHISMPQSEEDISVKLLSASGEAGEVPNENPDTVEASFTAVKDFKGVQIPERNGYYFSHWKFEKYIYELDGIFELSISSVWSQRKYSIEYDLAGGKISGEKNLNTYYPESDAFTLVNPTRIGYTFAGWIGADLTEPTVEVTVPTGSYGNREYIATWNPNEYTINYDANGGTVSSPTQTVAYDSDVEYLIPERTGYTFLGWYDGDVKVENEKWIRTSDISLVAKWEIFGYTIGYEMNGGTNHSDNPSKYQVDTDTITLKDPSRIGYTFLGWTYEGQTTPIKDVTIEKGSIGNKTFTANWEAISSTITLNPSGGSCTPVTIPVTYDQEFTLPDCVWAEHTFSGWYLDNTKVVSGVCKFDKDTTLVAKWDIVQYNISYTMNDGTNAGANPDSYNYYDTITLADPTRTGYTFLGWTFAGQTTPTKNVTIALGTTGDKSYTANWQANTYTITFDANGGSVTPTSDEVIFDINVTLPTPTRTGYTFDGWFVGTKQYTTGTWKTDSDITLVAKWIGNTYKVTYSDVGTDVKVTYNFNYTGTDNSVVTLKEGEVLSYPTMPIRSGYIFTGWYLDIACTEKFDFDVNISRDITLYAGWIKMNSDAVYSEIQLDPSKYNSSSNAYSISTSSTSSTAIRYIYLVAQESGTHYIYWKNSSSSSYYGYYLQIKNLTTDTVIRNASNTYSTSYNSVNFSCNKGDVIVISFYRYNTSYSSTAYFYFNKFNSPITSAKVQIPDGYVNYNLGENIEYSYTFGENYNLPNVTREGYTFDCWYYNGNKVESGEWKITDNATLTAKWIKNQYTVTLNANGGTCSDSSKTVTYDSSYTLPTPTRTGYTFDGWYYNGTPYESGTWKTTKNITLTAKWVARTDISYVVNHYQQNANDDGYTLESTQNPKGTADASITPAVKNYTHFISPSDKTVTIAPDGSLVVDYYYNRVTYDLTYVTNGGDMIEKQTYKYNQTLVISTPSRTGYTFGGWFTNKELTTAYSATAMLNADTTIYAYWVEENKPGDFTYSGTSAITVRAYNGTSTTMWIPAYIGGVPVTKIGSDAFENLTKLRDAIVSEYITDIGYSAFGGCSSLSSVTIGRGVTSIGGSAFSSCSSLVSVYITDITKWCNISFAEASSNPVYYAENLYLNGELVTNLVIPEGCVEIKPYTFYYCQSLMSVTFSNGVTSIGNSAFVNCDGLKSVTFSNSITSIGNSAFYSCDSIESLTIGNGVTSIGSSAFHYCKSLASLTIGDSVTNIGNGAFFDCEALEEIYFNATKMNDLSYDNKVFRHAGEDCNGTSVVIGSNVTKIPAYLFDPTGSSYESPKITSITISDSVKSIGSSAFHNCTSLENIYITDIGKWCEITFDSCYSNPLYYARNLYCNGELITNLVVPEGTIEVKDYAFAYFSGITSVTISNGVTSIGDDAFRNCDGLKSVTFSNSITIIGQCAFFACDGLENVTIGNSVNDIGKYAFSSCYSLKSVTIGAGIIDIGEGAFEYCQALEDIYFNATKMNDLVSNNKVFSNAGKDSGGIKIIIGENVTKIPANLFCPNNSSSTGSPNITSVIISNCVKSIGKYAFYCNSLASIEYRGTEAEWNSISKSSYWVSNTSNYSITYNYMDE